MNGEQVESIGFREYLGLLRRWLWLIVVATLLAAGIAFVVSKRTLPVYEASVTLLISEGQRTTGPDYNAILMSERLAKSYSQMLKGRPLLREVAGTLGLTLDDAELARLHDAISVEPVRDTQLIRLRVRHTDPRQAADIANTIPTVFLGQHERMQSARFASSKENLRREMSALQADVASAQVALDAERARPTPDSAEISRLETLLVQYRSTYASLLQSYEEIRVAEARGADSLIVTEPAEAPRRPVLPRTWMNTVLAGVVGAMLAVGVALIIEYLDDTVKGQEDVEGVTHLPAFATIGRFPRGKLDGKGPLVATEPRSPVAEAYRVLRTNVEFSALRQGDAATTLLVTSAQPMEGKTTTVANLGASLAQSRKRVLLVDADFRRPSLHTYFGLKNEFGLTSLLLYKSKDPWLAAQRTDVSGLRVLTVGHIPINPAEILGFPETADLFGRLRYLADYIIVDSPPALSVSDALILAQRVDGVVLVAEAGRTRRDALRRAVEALEGVKAPLLGVVLNKVSIRHGAYYNDVRYYADPARHRRQQIESGPVPFPLLGQSLQRPGHSLRVLLAAVRKRGLSTCGPVSLLRRLRLRGESRSAQPPKGT